MLNAIPELYASLAIVALPLVGRPYMQCSPHLGQGLGSKGCWAMTEDLSSTLQEGLLNIMLQIKHPISRIGSWTAVKAGAVVPAGYIQLAIYSYIAVAMHAIHAALGSESRLELEPG